MLSSLACLAFAACLLVLSSTHIAADDTLDFAVDWSVPVSPPVLPNLISFSIEVSDFSRWTGAYPAPTRPAFVQFMRQLMRTEGQEGPRWRIGGDSADSTVFNHSVLPKIPGRPLSYSVTEADLRGWKQAMEQINSTMTLDMNFRQANNATFAVEYVQGIDSIIGWDRVTALEVGNEVDLYGGGERYRPANYSYAIYKQEYINYVKSIQAAVPSLPKRIFQGLVNIAWDNLRDNLDDYLSDPTIEQSLYSISQHDYPVPSCIGNNVTIPDILNDDYSSSTSKFLSEQHTIEKLHAHNISFVIGEGSDAVCNGQGPMVLNTFATALFVVDQLMQAAASGIEHWYFHSWGFGTDTFSVLVYGNRAAPDRFLVQPIYYGLVMFAQATRDHARVVQLNVSSSSNSRVHAYATYDTRGALKVAVVHKDLAATAPTKVSFTIPYSGDQTVHGALIRLLAPSITSEYNVTLAGQTYDGSVDGLPIGTETEEQVTGTPMGSGMLQFSFSVQPLSAALLQIQLIQPLEPEQLEVVQTD